MGVPPARPRALARVSLGRGRHRRHLRRPAAAVLRARAVERRRSDPQGAHVRPDRQRGQPRRGREGVLLLPRQRAEPRVHEVPVQVSAACVPVRGSRAGERAAHACRSGVRAPRHRHLRRRPLLRRGRRVREGVADRHARAHQRDQSRGAMRRRCTCCPRCGSRTTGRGPAMPAGRASAVASSGDATVLRAVAPHAARVLAVLRAAAGSALHGERVQRAALVEHAQRAALREGRVPRVSRQRHRRSRESAPHRQQGGGALCVSRRSRRDGDRAPAVARGRDRGSAARDRRSMRCSTRARRRPTRFTSA